MEVKPGYKLTHVGVIPEDWEVRSLGGFMAFQNGVNADKDAYGDGVRFVNVLESITYTHLYESKIKGMVKIPSNLQAAYAVHYGDLLFNRTSETQEEVGLASVYLDKKLVVFGGFVIRGRPDADVLCPEYSGYAFRAPWIRSQIIPMGQGAVRANISQANLSSVLFPIPPLSEQTAIAKALSDVDDLLSALERLIAKKRDLKQAAMQQLLTGETRLPGFEGEWEEKRLGDIADIDPENLASNTKGDFSFQYISLEDVDRGILRNHTNLTFAEAPSRARRLLRDKDLLFSTVRPNLKSHFLFDFENGDWICSTGFCVVRCRCNVANNKFVYFHFFAGCVNKQIDVRLTGSNYPAISSSEVQSLKIPLPALPEQTAIAEILSDMDAEIIALEKRLEKTRALKQGMMQELLTGRTRLVLPGASHA